jgi:hypothetical protein
MKDRMTQMTTELSLRVVLSEAKDLRVVARAKPVATSTIKWDSFAFARNDTPCQIASPQCLFAPRNTKYFRDFSP